MQLNGCHIPGCNRTADKRCSSCFNLYCAGHFNDGHPYMLVSSDYLCEVFFCGFCHECWKKEVGHAAVFLLLLIVGASSMFFVVFNVISP